MPDISNYEIIKTGANNFYQKIGAIRCPALNNELVHFTSEGFNHLIYKGGRSERNKNDQVIKLKLLPNAKVIIGLTTTYQEYEESLMEIKKKKFKKIIKETIIVKYWGFVAIINNIRVKAIVRQLGNGQKHFWSVIPAWATSYYRGIKIISQAKGNLTDD